jgi:hypothetical protein
VCFTSTDAAPSSDWKIPARSFELIEVQTGSYLGEDDIIRIEDDYQRSCISPKSIAPGGFEAREPQKNGDTGAFARRALFQCGSRNLRDLLRPRKLLDRYRYISSPPVHAGGFCSKSLRDFMRAAADLIMRLLRG